MYINVSLLNSVVKHSVVYGSKLYCVIYTILFLLYLLYYIVHSFFLNFLDARGL